MVTQMAKSGKNHNCSARVPGPKGPNIVPVQSSGAQTLAFRSRLVGDLRVMSTVWQARDRTPPAVPELGGGRITERPPAHPLTQLHDGHALGQGHDRFFP